MVEIEGERVLAASCIRKPDRGHEGHDDPRAGEDSAQTWSSRCCSADQPPRQAAHDPESKLLALGRPDGRQRRAASLRPRGAARRPISAIRPWRSSSTPASNCNLCVRACREVQVNDVIGMAARGWHEKIVFDFDDPMGRAPASPAASACRPARPAR